MKAHLGSPVSPRRHKVVRWILGLVLFYAILGFFILPPIIRAIAVKQLSRQLDREVSIEKIKFNPFVLSATVAACSSRTRTASRLSRGTRFM